jgi:ribosomal protein S18 acetylase RimI-like enzyme
MECRFRPVFAIDELFLWEMLYYAAHVDEEPGASIEKAQRNPFLTKYVAHWGKPGDLGVLAYEVGTLESVGAAWLRVFVGAEKSCAAIEDGTPELAIAVAPSYIGRGVGAQLLTQLLALAATTYPAMYLNVRATNPAKRLYERFGFVVIGELTNRVGGTSLHMVKTLRKDITDSVLGK